MISAALRVFTGSCFDSPVGICNMIMYLVMLVADGHVEGHAASHALHDNAVSCVRRMLLRTMDLSAKVGPNNFASSMFSRQCRSTG